MNLDLVREMHQSGDSDATIGAVCGVSKDAIYRLRKKYGIGGAPQAVPQAAPPLDSDLTPIRVAAPPPSRATVAAGNFDLVASDMHFPEQDDECCDVFLETLRQTKAKRVILNGDTTDMLACSVYPKDQRDIWSLRSETEAFQKFLYQIHSIGDKWGVQVVETNANHSGNGVEGRWHRYLSTRVPELYKHPKSNVLLDYRTWFYPEWSNITLVDQVVIADDLLVIHGDVVRAKGGNSAQGMGDKWQSSVMHGHTHRLGSSFRRIPAMGSRPEMVRRMYETGCLCNLKPSYVSCPDWANGFAIINTDAKDTTYGVELVSIIGGAANICTLGQTVRAA
jgi:hypothetical protein